MVLWPACKIQLGFGFRWRVLKRSTNGTCLTVLCDVIVHRKSIGLPFHQYFGCLCSHKSRLIICKTAGIRVSGTTSGVSVFLLRIKLLCNKPASSWNRFLFENYVMIDRLDSRSRFPHKLGRAITSLRTGSLACACFTSSVQHTFRDDRTEHASRPLHVVMLVLTLAFPNQHLLV